MTMKLFKKYVANKLSYKRDLVRTLKSCMVPYEEVESFSELKCLL